MIQRNYVIIGVNDIDSVDWRFVMETQDTAVYNYAKTELILEYVGSIMPNFLNSISYQGPYNSEQMIQILSTSAWYIDSFDERANENLI